MFRNFMKYLLSGLLVLALLAPPLPAQSAPQATKPDTKAKKGAKEVPPPPPPPPPAPVPDSVDYDAIFKIKDEGLGARSKVMEILSYLTDVHGPRLTGSPVTRKAAEYAVKQLTDWGMANVKIEPWGSDFGRGWTNERFYMNVTAPVPFPIIGYPAAWTPGTNGMVTCEFVYARIDRDEDLAKYQGKLKDKCVMTTAMRAVEAHFEPLGVRYTDAQLEELSKQPIRATGPAAAGPGPGAPPQLQAQLAAFQMTSKIRKLVTDEGVAAWIQPGRGDGGTVFTGGGGSRNPKDPPAPVTLTIAIEHYGRIMRILEKNVPVTAELNIQNKFYDQDLSNYNIIGEIPGTDKADEIVMLGAHFDSWHAGTGATDNAAGSAVMMEVMRILKAAGLQPRRTVRIGLWNGEEQGLIGSREYVKAHFADRADMKLKPEHSKFSAYFNIDNGTGKIRGVYLQGNEAVAPTFKTWMEPFQNMGMTTLTIRNTGGTDHQSFDAVGLPGFQFIQDAVEYSSRTHHSNMDVYERIQEPDMKQIAVIVASFVYQTANRSQLLPRKPLPKPQPPQQPGGGRPPM